MPAITMIDVYAIRISPNTRPITSTAIFSCMRDITGAWKQGIVHLYSMAKEAGLCNPRSLPFY